MKKYFLPVILISLLFSAHTAWGEKFEFKHQVGDKYRFISTTKQETYYNNRLIQRANLVDRMASEVIAIDNGIARHSATFDLAEEIIESNNESHLQWSGENYTSIFGRDARGKITIDKHYFMPSVRDVPYFPDADIQTGHTWITRGNEVLDLRDVFNIPQPYEISFTANNTYLGDRMWKDKKYKTFKIDYTIYKRDQTNGFESSPRTYLPKTRGEAVAAPTVQRGISVVRGKSTQIIYWDEELGAIAAGEDEFELRFELSTGEVFVFKGATDVEMLEVETLDKEDVARDVAEELRKLGVEDASVTVVDNGVSISLENIQFAADSAELLPSEKTKLEKISSVLLKYNKRDILIAGHTAHAGNPAMSQPLSEQRASSVASYFIDNKVRPASRIITRGFGSSRPVADNVSEAGRQKNRRVEITILEN
jgi:outer membrane protein OmpA-like peptidoglycan-associated protein